MGSVVTVERSKAVVELPRTEADQFEGPADHVGVDGSDAVVQPPGFTIVEEDDVAFTLQLCREVHRLYGDYQDGSLPSDDYVQAGLTVTMEMLAILSGRVADGMPAMRITVAAAQTREMLAVMFGRDPLDGPIDGRFRAHFRAIVDESARALASAAPPLPEGWADAALGRSGRGIGAGGTADDAPTDAAPTDAAPTDTAAQDAPLDGQPGPFRRSVLRRLFGRRTK